MDSGDFAFLDRDSNAIGIERAAIGNLLEKLRSGELESQLERMFKSYKQVILLGEGVYDEVGTLVALYKQYERNYGRIHIYPSTYYSSIQALIDRLQEFGVQYHWTANFECSKKDIVTTYKSRVEPEEKHTFLKRSRPLNPPMRMSTNPLVSKLMGLVDRLPEKVAIRLIDKYKNIITIVRAMDSEYGCEVEGFGKGLQENLRKSIGL